MNDVESQTGRLSGLHTMDHVEAQIAVADRGSRGFGIASVDDLREHLQWAIELEHATLPSYLCALYSLDPARNREPAEIVSSVFLEEMLHMALEVSLLAFGTEALELFLKIEQPAPSDAQAEGDAYETIGQFYAAIAEGLRELCAQLGESEVFSGDPARQVTNVSFHGGARGVMAVDGLGTALLALKEIVEQGEGAEHVRVWDGDLDMFHPEREELGHYYRLQQLILGRRYRRGDTPDSGPSGDGILIDWAGVRPMRPNPRTSDHAPGCPIRRAQEDFNHAYCGVLHLLEHAFNGKPYVLARAIGAMFHLKAQAEALMQIPTHDGLAVAGPTFEYVFPER